MPLPVTDDGSGREISVNSRACDLPASREDLGNLLPPRP